MFGTSSRQPGQQLRIFPEGLLKSMLGLDGFKQVNFS